MLLFSVQQSSNNCKDKPPAQNGELLVGEKKSHKNDALFEKLCYEGKMQRGTFAEIRSFVFKIQS